MGNNVIIDNAAMSVFALDIFKQSVLFLKRKITYLLIQKLMDRCSANKDEFIKAAIVRTYVYFLCVSFLFTS